jgi:hypothetical protein
MQPSQRNGCNIQVSQFRNHSWAVYFYIYIKDIVCILTLECNLFLLFFCVRFQGTTNEAFVVNAIQLAAEHCQLYIHHHAAKVIKVATKYRTNMGIPNSSSLEK